VQLAYKIVNKSSFMINRLMLVLLQTIGSNLFMR